MDIVVLAGGLSTERDVSFVTGNMVSKALRKNGHRVILLDVFMGYSDKKEDISDIFEHTEEVSVQVEEIPTVAPDLAAVKASRADQSDNFFGPNVIEICQKADVVFMALHGENGENGKIQAAFDLFGIRYTGTGYLGSALAMDKNIAKQFFVANGIPTPGGIRMKRGEQIREFSKTGLNLPCVVKPCCGGSSIGVSIVRTVEEYEEALEEAFRWEEEILIEDYIEGREFSVGVLEGKALPIIEIAPVEGFYDYKNKYKLFYNKTQTSYSLSLSAGSLSIRTLPALPLSALSLFLPTPIITIALTAPVCLIGFCFFFQFFGLAGLRFFPFHGHPRMVFHNRNL